MEEQAIINQICFIRGQKVMLDLDLSSLYDIPVKRINEQVKRNAERFPPDFMFQLTAEELENLRSQIATSRWGGRRYLPYAFTEHGVLMLSSVLNSPVAIQVNIRIVRIYIRMRELLLANKEMLQQWEKLERRLDEQGVSQQKLAAEMQQVFTLLKELLQPERSSRKRIGYLP